MPRLLFHLAQLTFVSPLVAIIFFYELMRCQYLRPVTMHGDRVLKMRRRLAVSCPYGPAVAFLHYVSRALVDHGFNGEHHTRDQLYTFSALTIIRHIRLLMQLLPYPMTY